MPSRLRIVLILAAAFVIPGSLALASVASAEPPAPVAGAAAQLLRLDTALSATPLVCPRADLPAFPPTTVQPLANDICGGCSDAACFGKEINSVCGVGFRCILQAACTPVAPSCRCLIIG